MAKEQTALTVETLKHDEAPRTNIPTAEHQSVLAEDVKPSNFKKSIDVYITGERKEIQKVFTTNDGEHLWR
jgi:hypothetical protein